MKVTMFSVAVLMVAIGAHADHGFAIIPSLEVREVSDDNLNFTADEPLRDRIRRVSPSLGLRFDSPRLHVTGGYSIDSERYAIHSTLDSQLARARADLGIRYQTSPRLTLSVQSVYLDTNTLADLNADTGLAGSRVRGRRLSFDPSMTYRVSPRVTARLAASSATTNVVNGVGMRTQNQTLDIERRVTARDLFSVGYAHSHLLFSGANSQTIDGHTLLAGWTHDLGMHDRIVLQAGPRMTNHSPSADLAASLTHHWRISSLALSLLRNQTTVVAYAGAVDIESLQARFTIAPNRRLTAYTEPAIIRSTDGQLQGTVYRLGVGARYAITSFLDANVAYNKDTQNGAIDPLRPDAKLSRTTFSIGLGSRWNSPERSR